MRLRRAISGLLLAGLVSGALTGCGGASGTGSGPSGARVVPADSLAFVQLRLGPGGAAGRDLARRLGIYRSLRKPVLARLGEITGVPFATGIAPWLGNRVALALVPAGSGAQALIVLSVRDPAGARAFVHRLHHTARLRDGEVLVGEPAVLAAADRGPALATLGAYRRAMIGAPAGRVLEAWAPRAGAAALLPGHGGLATVVAQVLMAAHAADVGAALVPTRAGARVWVHLDTAAPSPALPHPRVASAAAGGVAGLLARLPAAGTDWAAGAPDLLAAGPDLLDAFAAAGVGPGGAGAAVPAVAAAIGRLDHALNGAGVAPAALGRLLAAPGVLFGLDGGLGLIVATRDVTGARRVLSGDGAILSQLFGAPAGPGMAPEVSTHTVAGTPVTVFADGPGAQLAVAAGHGVALLSTAPAAVDAILAARRGPSLAARLGAVTAGTVTGEGPVLFGVINALIRRDDPGGLLRSLGLTGARPVLTRMGAAALVRHGASTSTTAELYFTIS